MWMICIFTCVCRIGEASNPGPKSTVMQDWQIGCINPTGLLGKSHLLADLPKPGPTIWAVSESHLTAPGMHKLKAELAFHKTGYHMHMGAPVPPRSQTISTVGGKQRGVGFLTTEPGRAMTSTWPKEAWHENRFHAACFQMGNRWVQGGVIYGYAVQPHCISTRQSTDQQCQYLTDRLLNQSTGLRFIAGDFNQEAGVLDNMQAWADAGWIQCWAQQTLGKPIAATCKHKTTVDHLYVSPELAMYLKDVFVEHDWFPDHAILRATFNSLEAPPLLPLWRKPQPLDWENITTAKVAQHYSTAQQQDDTTKQYQALWQAVEQAHQHIHSSNNSPMPSATKGRAATLEVTWRQEYSKPPKPGREGEHQPNFHGVNLRHAQWTRQYRRLVAWHRMCENPQNKLSFEQHKQQLWTSITKAAGFFPDFIHWWNNDPKAPCHLNPEPSQQSAEVVNFFHSHLQAMEHSLNSARRQGARQRRKDDPNIIFRDVRREPPLPVQMLVHNPKASIVSINQEDNAVVVDPPQEWIADQPAKSKTMQKPIVYAEADTLWLDDVNGLEVGDSIQQDQYIGGLQDLFQKFGDEWSKRWDRHKDSDLEPWRPILDFAKLVLPQVPPIPHIPIDELTWKKTLQKKSKRSAVGPDGVSRQDLLSLPPQATQDLLNLLTSIEQGKPWPQQLTTGFVIALEKIPGASTTGQFRPITLLPIVYRLWGSIRAKSLLQHLCQFAPTTCTGNLPGRQASQVWYTIMSDIERSQLEAGQMSGAVLDLIKAFNLIPRVPVFGILQILGICPAVALAWNQALHQLERRFQIRNCIGPPHRSTAGFPEGCALSVVSMLALNLVGHAYIKLRYLHVTLWTYVDNIELTGPSASQVANALEGYKSLSDLLDVSIDHQKTYAWSIDASQRQALRAEAIPTRLAARDLGGHMAYSKTATNSTITARCNQAGPLWNKLARSMAPYDQKLRVLRTKAWPAFLHGIASVHLADDHFDRLRTGAVRAIGEHSAGVAPAAHLSLVEPTATDPQFHAIWVTLTTCRQMEVTTDHMHFCMQELHMPIPRVTARPGPMSVILHRLHQVAWSWICGSQFADQWGYPIDILQCPVQELRQRLTHAWQSRVQHTLSGRKTFAGMTWMSPTITMQGFDSHDPEDRAILRTCLNGTFFTADRPVNQEVAENDSCKYCGQPDSQVHRHWHCPHFAQCRSLTASQIETIEGLPPCVLAHGWMPEPPAIPQFRKLCMSIPDLHTDIQWPLHTPKTLDCFTDGGCKAPMCQISRLAGWGVVVGLTDGSFWPVSQGLVPGWVQTAMRAELYAALSACVFLHHTKKPARLWVDNATVHRRLKAFLTTPTTPVGPNARDADLWNAIRRYALTIGPDMLQVFHVHSHQDLNSLDNVAEEWICAGNHQADHLADTAMQQHPLLEQTWHTLQQDLTHVKTLKQAVHKTLLAVGKHAVRSQYTAPRPDKQYASRLPAEVIETNFGPATTLRVLPALF